MIDPKAGRSMQVTHRTHPGSFMALEEDFACLRKQSVPLKGLPGGWALGREAPIPKLYLSIYPYNFFARGCCPQLAELICFTIET